MRFGLHVSIAGALHMAVERARKRTCDTIQIFAGNPRTWDRWEPDTDDVRHFLSGCAEYHLAPVVVHAPYLVNLATPSDETFHRSKAAVANALRVCDTIGSPYYVVHTGSSVTSGKAEGIARIGHALTELLAQDDSDVMILLENMAGGGSSLGVRFEELAEIIDITDGSNRLGICLDTCHAFAAGYDLSTEAGVEATLRELDATIGIERLGVIHANDSKYPLGSAHDRHADIGAGYIGRTGFSHLVNHRLLAGKPIILETPRQTVADDLRNISTLRELYGKHL